MDAVVVGINESRGLPPAMIVRLFFYDNTPASFNERLWKLFVGYFTVEGSDTCRPSEMEVALLLDGINELVKAVHELWAKDNPINTS